MHIPTAIKLQYPCIISLHQKTRSQPTLYIHHLWSAGWSKHNHFTCHHKPSAIAHSHLPSSFNTQASLPPALKDSVSHATTYPPSEVCWIELTIIITLCHHRPFAIAHFHRYQASVPMHRNYLRQKTPSSPAIIYPPSEVCWMEFAESLIVPP